MKEILDKLYTYWANKAVDDILTIYDSQKHVIWNFIYFAVINQQKLFYNWKKTTEQKEYKKYLLNSDFLFPDGMALQTYWMMANRFWFKLPTKHLPNLNGTDFIPYFLDEIKKRYWSQRIRLFLYWSKPEIAQECKKIYTKKWFNVMYAQDWFSEFDRKKINNTDSIEKPINVMLVARWTPIQELRVQKNLSKIIFNNLIIFTVWGLFDFIAASWWNENIQWVQKRAPKLVRKLKLERLRRFILDPKRNRKKIKSTLIAPIYVFKYLVLKKE